MVPLFEWGGIRVGQGLFIFDGQLEVLRVQWRALVISRCVIGGRLAVGNIVPQTSTSEDAMG